MNRYEIDFQFENLDIEDPKIDRVISRTFPKAFWGYAFGNFEVSTEIEAKNGFVAAKQFAIDLRKNFPEIILNWDLKLVSYSAIAELAKVTPEAVRLWSIGERGKGDFPKPVSHISNTSYDSPLWTWAEINNWLIKNKKVKGKSLSPDKFEVGLIQGFLAEKNIQTEIKYSKKSLVNSR